MDFRGSGQPRRRELALNWLEDLTSGVLNLTGFGHVAMSRERLLDVHPWPPWGCDQPFCRRRASYLCAMPEARRQTLTQSFARNCWADREGRRKSHRTLWDHEVRNAWRQYDALFAYARSTQLAREVDRDRGDEMSAAVHGPVARMLLRVASIASGGLHTHHDTMNESMVAKLDQQRRDAYLKLQKLQVQSLPPVSDPLVAGRASGEPPPDSASVLAKLGVGQ